MTNRKRYTSTDLQRVVLGGFISNGHILKKIIVSTPKSTLSAHSNEPVFYIFEKDGKEIAVFAPVQDSNRQIVGGPKFTLEEAMRVYRDSEINCADVFIPTAETRRNFGIHRNHWVLNRIQKTAENEWITTFYDSKSNVSYPTKHMQRTIAKTVKKMNMGASVEKHRQYYGSQSMLNSIDCGPNVANAISHFMGFEGFKTPLKNPTSNTEQFIKFENKTKKDDFLNKLLSFVRKGSITNLCEVHGKNYHTIPNTPDPEGLISRIGSFFQRHRQKFLFLLFVAIGVVLFHFMPPLGIAYFVATGAAAVALKKTETITSESPLQTSTYSGVSSKLGVEKDHLSVEPNSDLKETKKDGSDFDFEDEPTIKPKEQDSDEEKKKDNSSNSDWVNI